MDLDRSRLDPHAPRRPPGVSPGSPQRWPSWVVPLVCAGLAAAARVPLLWDDPWAPGYDGWYYVLQTRSWLSGEPLFADRSLLFPVLALVARATGDVVVGNKLAACAFAAVGAAGVAVGARRWTGAPAAGLVAGTWWAVAPGHLTVSLEFLKNEAGLALLGVLLAVLPCVGHRRGSAPVAVGLAVGGLLVHKLTGVLGLVLAAGTVAAALGPRLRCRVQGERPTGRRRGGWALRGGAGLLAVAVVLGVVQAGVLRGVDLTRFLAPQPGDGPRLDLLLHSARIHPVHRVSLLVAHVLPVALVAATWRSSLRGLGLPLAAVALAVAAPGLPFGFDLTAWRLLLLAFVPMAFALALVAARLPGPAGIGVAGMLTVTLSWTVPHVERAEPDYAAWAEVVPLLQAHVPAEARVVAHRGVCGFVWAVADRVCENFDPQGPAEGWWRIAYGMGHARLVPYSDPPPVRLRSAYTLLPEAAWRRFRDDHADTLPLVRHARNPHRPRPGFVYGPQRDTPDGPVELEPSR